MLLLTSPLLATAVLLLVSFLLVQSGRTKKRLVMRSPTCPVCHNDRKRCTCHWL